MSEILPLGTKTPWGEIVAVCSRSGERYYFMGRGSNDVALIDAYTVENHCPPPSDASNDVEQTSHT